MISEQEQEVTRCAGCGFSHVTCLTQRDAVEFIHRLAAEAIGLPRWLVAEYEERWA